MAVILPAGSIAKVVVGDANTTLSLNPHDIMNAVAANLTAQGYRVISNSASGGLLSTITPLIVETFQATYEIQVPFQTDTDALGSTVLQAHLEVSESVSSIISVPSYVLAGQSEIVATGQPGATPTTSQSIIDAIKKAFSGITGATTTILVAIAGIIILVLVLLAYGPNVKHIAGAIA